MKKIFVLLTCWRFFAHWIYFKYAKNRDVISDDLARNISQFVLKKGADNYSHNDISFYRFCYLLSSYKMVRNIFYARVARYHRLFVLFLKMLAPSQSFLDISPTADIGGGLIIQHGYSTIIDPIKMGRNCWVNQNVTIGYANDVDAPIIGDNVTVYTGAVIVGAVIIGNNVIVAANAAVVNDVNNNCVVGGVPAKIIKNQI